MPVHHHIRKRIQLIQGFRLLVQHIHEPHHLSQAQHPRMGFVLCHVLCQKFSGAVGVNVGGRHRRGHHHIDVRRNLLRRVQDIVHPPLSADVHDLMRIRHDPGGPFSDDILRKLQGGHHGGFNMYMGVDQPRGDVLARAVNLPFPFVAPQSHNAAVHNGHITGDDLL